MILILAMAFCNARLPDNYAGQAGEKHHRSWIRTRMDNEGEGLLAGILVSLVRTSCN